MSDDDPLAEVSLFYLLGMGFQLVLADFVTRLHAEGYEDLRPIHGLAFQAILDGADTATELAERIGVTKQAAGQIVDYLAEAGYLERKPHPSGGRRRLLELTAKGRAQLSTAGRALAEGEQRLARDVDPEDLRAARRVLAQLIRELAGDDIPPLRPSW